MIPWIVLAVGVVLAWLLFGRRPGRGGSMGPPSTLETWIVIEGTAANPRVKEPVNRLCGERGDRLVWHVKDETGGNVEVWLPHFKHPTKPGDDPLEGPANARKNRPDATVIRDKIKQNAEYGTYKYDVYLNGKLALDPDLEIRGI